MKPKPYPKTWSRDLRISLYESDARKARLAADLERHTVRREPLSWLGKPIAVGVIDIPIWQPQSFYQEKPEMTTQQKIDYLKANPVTVTNVQRVPHLNGKFDPRPVFTNTAVHALFPDAGRDDFSDDRSNSPRDDFDEPNEHSNLGMAADLINCEISGESGPGCGHNGVDHVARAIDCLQNYSRDQAMRDKHRADAGQHSVRFA